MSKCNLQEATMEVARRLALKTFAGEPDLEAKVNDAVSYAWQFSRTAAESVTPSGVARNAVRYVASWRRFTESQLSIDSPVRSRSSVIRPERIGGLDVTYFSRPGDDPALIVQMRMDLEVWWSGLSKRQRQAAEMLAMGQRPGKVARLLGVSQGRISQLKTELRAKWEALQS